MSGSEENFEALRRLLALKRHEVPPPGYFNDFSRQIVARLRAGGTAEESAAGQRFGRTPSLLKQLFELFEAKPAIIGSFACVLCLILLVGIVYAERPDAAPKAALMATMATPELSLAGASAPGVAPLPASGGLMVSTNPVLNLQPVSSIFGQQNPLLTPVSLNAAGN